MIIYRYIFKNMKKAFKKVDKEDRAYQHQLFLKDKQKKKKQKTKELPAKLDTNE